MDNYTYDIYRQIDRESCAEIIHLARPNSVTVTLGVAGRSEMCPSAHNINYDGILRRDLLHWRDDYIASVITTRNQEEDRGRYSRL